VEPAATLGGLCGSVRHPATGELYCPYGTHVFATSDERVWRYVTGLTPFTFYRHTVYGVVGGRATRADADRASGDPRLLRRPHRRQAGTGAGSRRHPRLPWPADQDRAGRGVCGLRPAPVRDVRARYVSKQWSVSPAHLAAEVLTERFTIRRRLVTVRTPPRSRSWRAVPPTPCSPNGPAAGRQPRSVHPGRKRDELYQNMAATVGAALDLAAGLTCRYDLTRVEAR
jgi:hypothetical protein